MSLLGLQLQVAHTLQQEDDSENNFVYRLVTYIGHLGAFFFIESKGDLKCNLTLEGYIRKFLTDCDTVGVRRHEIRTCQNSRKLRILSRENCEIIFIFFKP